MAYYQQTSDDYFVKSHNDHERQLRDDLRERERYEKRQTQISIAEELSQIASEEYLADILLHMEDMEVKHPSA